MSLIVKIILQRVALGLVTLFIVSLVIFLGVELLPGDFTQAVLGQTATPETIAAFRKKLGLDLPPHTRYIAWLGGILQGDLGTSLSSDRAISELIQVRLGNTVFLAIAAAFVAVPLAVALGVLTALYRNSWFDRTVNTLALTAISVPEYFAAYVLILIFAVKLGLFPSMSNVTDELSFWEHLYRVFLPAMTLTLVVIAHMMRMTRASIINLLASPFIEMATMKGIKRSRIVIHHALPNALAPIINVIALNLAYLIVGVVIVEVVFVYPGVGLLLVESVSKRDIPVVQACSLIFAATYIVLNMTADILSIICNPRLLHPR